MVNESTNDRAQHQPPAPNPALKKLDKLVGTWEMTGRESGPEGEIHGQMRFEWLEGGYFLVQRTDINHVGHQIKGIEYIGYGRDFYGNAPEECSSQYFDNDGNNFQYVWEVDDDNLTIWGGYVGSPAAFKGTFSEDGNAITGAWEWPGGGYTATMTRVEAN